MLIDINGDIRHVFFWNYWTYLIPSSVSLLEPKFMKSAVFNLHPFRWSHFPPQDCQKLSSLDVKPSLLILPKCR